MGAEKVQKQADASTATNKVRWGRLLAYLTMTFAMTWGLHAANSALTGACGLPDASPPLGMLAPAFVALAFQMFLDKDSKLRYPRSPRAPRILMTAYMVYTAVLVGVVLFENGLCREPTGSRMIANLGAILWTLLALNLYQRDQGNSFQAVGLGLGPAKVGVRIVTGVVVFLLLQPFFNWIFGLGSFQGLQTSIEGIRLPGWLYPIGLVGFLAIAIVGGPLGNLIFMFGEEFGWRGFLLGELEKLGRLPAALAVGLIWWAWHIPIILAGVHTYPPTLLGFSLALIFFTLWGIVQSYAVLKTRSVWTAAFIHGLVNGVYAFTLQYLVRPVDKLFSFGLGTYGLILMFLVVLWLLRDPVWRTSLTMPDSSTAVQDR